MKMKAISLKKYHLIDKGEGYILSGKNGDGYFGIWTDPEDVISIEEDFIIVEDFIGEYIKEYVEVINLPNSERENIKNLCLVLRSLEA